MLYTYDSSSGRISQVTYADGGAGAKGLFLADELGDGLRGIGGVAAADGLPQFGKAMKVTEIEAMLRAKGELPDDFKLVYLSRNYMRRPSAAGYGGADVDA